jgi:photosystem II stability/assembly factor-like uncharacterized protein
VSELPTPVLIIIGGLILATIVFTGRLLFLDEASNPVPSSVLPIATMTTADSHALMVDATNPNAVFFGSHSGIHESRDGGLTWNASTLQDADAMAIAVSPSAPGTIYVAGHHVFLVSNDSGTTWQAVSHNLPGTDIHAFAQSPLQPQRLYAFVVDAGVYTSADGGAQWEPLATQPGEGSPVALASDGVKLYASMPLGIMVSSDHGQSWLPLPSNPAGGAVSLAISPIDSSVLFAGTTGGIANSVDGGQSWTTLALTGSPVVSIAIAPSDPDRLLALAFNGAIFRSDDEGVTWE